MKPVTVSFSVSRAVRNTTGMSLVSGSAFSFFAMAKPDMPPIITSSSNRSKLLMSISSASSAELAVSTA